MDDIFKKFSPDAKNILFSAQRIATGFSKPIDTNHLLLAMTTEKSTLSYEILKSQRPNIDKIYVALNLNTREGVGKKKKPDLSKDVREFLKDALKTAESFGHYRVGSEHFLLTLVGNNKYSGHKTLIEANIDVKLIREQIIELFEESERLEKMEEMLFESEEGIPSSPFEGGGIAPGASTKLKKKKKKTPALDFFADDLTEKASKDELDPVIGRKEEIGRLIQILNRRTKNNPVLLGDPGVGKTAIVEGLAQKIADGESPTELRDMRVLSLDLSLLVAGTKYRGEFEERIKKVMDEIMSAENIILFVDEVHSIVGIGSAEGSMDAANILKPALAKGKIRLIGATTFDEYRKFIEKDSALERRMQTIMVEEPKSKEVKQILEGLRSNYEKHHKVKITDEAIKAAIELSKRYISDRFLPDKAIDLIDEASSKTAILKSEEGETGKQKKLYKERKKIKTLKEKAVKSQDYEQAVALRNQENKLKMLLSKLKREGQKKQRKERTIGKKEVASVVSFWTGVPVSDLVKDEKDKYANLEKKIEEKIIGQNKAVKTITAAIRKSRVGVAAPERPIGSFIFLGPTGVGKTELAKILAETLFGDKDAIVKIDMSEFMEKHNVSRLVGAPPGYVGFEEGGKLTEAIRRRPYSVVLLDEIEKAHPEVQNILLQILEDGYITDAAGKRVNFRNSLLIITSNIGTEALNREAAVGFRLKGKNKGSFEQELKSLEDDILSKVEDHFRPEFLNRLDKIIIFKPLNRKEIFKIAELEIEKLVRRIKRTNKIELKVEKEVIGKVAEEGFDEKLGARPIRRKIAEMIEDPLSDELLKNRFKSGETTKIGLKKGKVNFSKK